MTIETAPCSREAARHAVMHWHYSQTMPSGKLVTIGAWEDGEFIGAVLFGRGANRHIGDPFGLTTTQICELVRVALTDHVAPVSQIVAQALRWLRHLSPGIRAVVSYADTAQGHHGGIYQAGNWLFTGDTDMSQGVRIHGREMHTRSVSSMYGTRSIEWLRTHVDSNAEVLPSIPKHRYVIGLDRKTKKQLAPLALPYPNPVASLRG